MKILSLKKGETIGVVGVSAPANPQRVKQGLENIRQLGFSVKVSGDPSLYFARDDQGAVDLKTELFVTGSASLRAKNLMSLVEDADVKVIVCARGAYGSFEILPYLDFEKIKQLKKTIVGFSDCTALLNAVYAKTGLVMIHGPCLASEFSDYQANAEAQESVDNLLNLVSSTNYRLSSRLNVLRSGNAEAPILGGNLTALCSLLGTDWEPDFSGKILFLEEIGEKPFRIYRMLNQLRLSGKFEKLAGLVFGRFSKCLADLGPTAEDVINSFPFNVGAGYNFPVLTGLEFGHLGKNFPLAIGCRAEIKGNIFSLLESPLA